MAIFTCTLPLPPSVNAMYKTTRHFGFYKSKEAKDWEKECIKKLGKRKTFKGDLDVEIFFYFKRDGDIDNRIKALLDLLQHAGIMEDDRQVQSLLVNKTMEKENPRVDVLVMNN